VQYVVSLLFAAICYFIYSYVAVCMFCAVRCVIIICCYLLFSVYSIYVSLIFFLYLFSCFIYLFYFVYSVFLYCLSFYMYGCLFPISVQVYRPPPSGGNPTEVNKFLTYYLLT